MTDAQNSNSVREGASVGQQRAAAICCALVGAVFVFSAGAKMAAIGAFEIQLVKQGLLGSREAAMWPARLLVAVELFIGLGLLQPWQRRRFFSPVAAGLLLLFSAWLAWLLVSGSKVEDCGCFGELLKISPSMALLRNGGLLLLLLIPWRWLVDCRGWHLPTAAAVAALAGTLILAPPRMPPADPGGAAATAGMASPFAAFNSFTDGAVDLTAGPQLVAFFSLDCEHCRDLAGRMARTPGLPPLHVLYLGDASQVPDFEGMSGSAFPWHIPPPGQFFDFIGDSPPRVYLLVNGEVRGRWDGDEFTADAVADLLH